LNTLATQFSLTAEESATAHSVVNDCFLTDLPLLYAPHIITITALVFGVAFKTIPGNTSTSMANQAMTALQQALLPRAPGAPKSKLEKIQEWIAGGAVDIGAWADASQEVISLYAIWDEFNEKACKEQLMRFVKARGLDK
jgi:cyclin C